mmetsp:Transcript_9654/g.18742  ORF Transcript_9654/g.18742 Transcript_9654/m.18742 type:complete len:202 (-) Transcript_9654:465-1070(-)
MDEVETRHRRGPPHACRAVNVDLSTLAVVMKQSPHLLCGKLALRSHIRAVKIENREAAELYPRICIVLAHHLHVDLALVDVLVRLKVHDTGNARRLHRQDIFLALGVCSDVNVVINVVERKLLGHKVPIKLKVFPLPVLARGGGDGSRKVLDEPVWLALPYCALGLVVDYNVPVRDLLDILLRCRKGCFPAPPLDASQESS